MRSLVALLVLLPLPAAAERFEAIAPVTAATVYGRAAILTREIKLTAPAGRHELFITGLPTEDMPLIGSPSASDGVQVLSARFAQSRQPVTEDHTAPEIKAAEDEVELLELALREAERGIEQLMLEAEAAEAHADFLRRFGTDGSDGITGPEMLTALGQTLGTEFLAARKAATAARYVAEDADRQLKDQREALDKARQALDALATQKGKSTLIVELDVAKAGPLTLSLIGMADEAYWTPSYELRLSRGASPQLIVTRSVTVTQHTSEDWSNVALTLSTSRLDAKAATPVAPERRTIYDETQYSKSASSEPPVAVAEAPEILYDIPYETDFAGGNVRYSFPDPVTLRSDADRLTLSLSSLTLTPVVLADAAPLFDATAHMVALVKNTSTELILPGSALLWFDGTLVGEASLPLVAPGAETEIGFGPIDGIQLKRITPDRSQGSAGLIGRSYQLNEQVQIEIENLTAEAWPMRLTDRAPYSEQDSLTVNWTADPMPTETDRKGARGVLEWRFDLEPGAKRQVQLDWQLRWPSGYALQ